MKRISIAASGACAIVTLAVIGCGGTAASAPGGEANVNDSHPGTPGGSAHAAAPAPPKGRSPAEAVAEGGTPSHGGEDGGTSAPDGQADVGGWPNPFGDAGIEWPFHDGGYSFETGTSSTFDSGISISFEDGGFTIH